MRRPPAPRGPQSIRPASPREFAVLAEVVRFGSYKEAAAALGISTQTVKNHLTALHRVTGMTTTQLANHYSAQLRLYMATVPPPDGMTPRPSEIQ